MEFYLTPEVNIHNIWDLQPFKDQYRSLWPSFTKTATKLQKTPGLKWLGDRMRNLEVLEPLNGGFTLDMTVPKGTVGVWSGY